MNKRHNTGETACLDFKMNCKATIINCHTVLAKNRYVDQWNKIVH